VLVIDVGKNNKNNRCWQVYRQSVHGKNSSEDTEEQDQEAQEE
jgi:hypothetical protein